MARTRLGSNQLPSGFEIEDSSTGSEDLREIAKEVAKEEIEKLSAKVEKDLNIISKSLRADFMIIFGLFASVITFLTVEIKLFQITTRFSMLVGTSLFILGAMLLFAFTLRSIIEDRSLKQVIKSPLLIIIGVVLLGSEACFYWAAILNPR